MIRNMRAVADLPEDAFRPCFDRVATVYGFVRDHRFGATLPDIHRHALETTGKGCQRSCRRALQLLVRLELVYMDNGRWFSRPTSPKSIEVQCRG